MGFEKHPGRVVFRLTSVERRPYNPPRRGDERCSPLAASLSQGSVDPPGHIVLFDIVVLERDAWAAVRLSIRQQDQTPACAFCSCKSERFKLCVHANGRKASSTCPCKWACMICAGQGSGCSGTSSEGSGSQLESLILAQNERWRHA